MHDSQHDAAPAAVRREDYRPPAFLVETVDLHFDLDPAATIVRARLALRRDPAHGDPSAPLRLDGEALTLLALRLDGVDVRPGAYTLEPDGRLLVAAVPDACVLETEVRIAPDKNTEFSGLY